MEKNNPYLDKLVEIQTELKNNQARLDALETGDVKDQIVISETTKRATFSDFLSPKEIKTINRSFSESLNKKISCDRLDYSLACACGVICGLIDVLLIKTPQDGIIGDTTDKLFDRAVKSLAGKNKNGEESNISSAIAFFENKAKVTYDQAKTQEIKKQLSNGFTETIEHLSTKNHHAKSLSHYPDIFGLISSICNQFTNTSTFLDTSKGKITIVNGTDGPLELQGSSMPAKIFSGFVNWLFHCISDVAGSSGNRSQEGSRGTGLPMPFTELFQFCNFGAFKNEKRQNQTLATVMVKTYEEGYDLRHGVASTVPVLIDDLLIRAVFIIKHYFYDNVSLTDLHKTINKDKLQRMITVGVGALCLVDVSEAVITSWGNWVVLFSHLNVSAWNRLAMQGMKELHILRDREMHNIEMIELDITETREDLLQRSRILAEGL